MSTFIGNYFVICPKKSINAIPSLLWNRFSKRTFLLKAFKDLIFNRKLKKDERMKKWLKDIEKSGFADLNEFTRSQGKLFSASGQIIPVHLARLVPKIQGFGVDGNEMDILEKAKGKITLLTVSYNTLAYSQTSSFKEPFLNHFQQNPLYQCIEINVIEKWIYKLFYPMIKLSFARLPKERKHFIMNRFGNLDFALPNLNIVNKYFGYVFLIDRQGKIRWIANGQASPEEIKFMITVAESLSLPSFPPR